MDSGMKLEKSGHYTEAKAALESALRTASSVRKDGRVLLSEIALGSIEASMGQYTEAEGWDNQAVRLGEELYGKESPDLAAPFTNLAALYRDQGDYARAEEFGRRALQVVSQPTPADPTTRAHVLGALGGILSRRGKREEAEADLRQSIAIAEKLAAASDILAGDWNNLAGLYAGMGRYSEALQFYREAYELSSRINGDNDPNLFFILAGMAAVQARSGQYADAVTSMQSAIQRADAGGPAMTILMRDALLAQAEWLHKLKRESEAKRVRARAKQVAETVAHNSYSQYTVDAGQIAKGIVKKPD